MVTKVIDGDTIHVLINGTDYKVPYIDMNASEDTTKKEWLGPDATSRDKELVADKTVTLVKDVSETDRVQTIAALRVCGQRARELRARARGVHEGNAV